MIGTLPDVGLIFAAWGLTVRYAARLLTVIGSAFLAMAAMAPPAEARRVALVIGNGAYQHTSILPNAANDARVIAQRLRGIGFTVTEASDLGYQSLRETIRTFGQSAQGAEMALVYYAGHGLEVAGENWLVPVSAALNHERDLEYEAVSLTSILTAVQDAKRLRLVILDACRNNPLSDRLVRSAATRSVARGLARVEPTGDILVAYSAKHGTLAEDGPAGGNSPFAAALARNMDTPGLDVRIMLGKVRDDVRQATAGRQEPFTYGSVGGTTVALLPGSATAVAPPPNTPQPRTGRFGALAVSSPDGGWGNSWGWDSPETATQKAMAECRKHASNCRLASLFQTVCVTVVRTEEPGKERHIAWAEGQTKAARMSQALRNCRSRGGRQCRLLAEFCTGAVQDR